ncbi:MAG TPA: hypothetical protein VEW71_08035 [Allosphingosinicella sp.]|nr:hypothetical protein [Allosphingosinicella sp.]
MSNASDQALLAEADAVLAENAAEAHAPVAAQAAQAAEAAGWWSNTNAMTMCAVLLLFGLIVMGLSTYLLKAGQPAQSVLRVFGTLLVIIMASFLVVAGYTNEQLAAPMGLLGTVAGYLLGRQTTDDRPPPARTAESGS